jgi:hypothetical protein
MQSGSIGIASSSPTAGVGLAVGAGVSTFVTPGTSSGLSIYSSNAQVAMVTSFRKVVFGAANHDSVSASYSAPSVVFAGNSGYLLMRSTGNYIWSNDSSDAEATADVGLGRAAAGFLRINSGTPSSNNGGGLAVGATSTPWAKLSVAGSAAGSIPLFAISSSTAGFSTSTAFVIDSNGLVGIGTTTPYTQLSVQGTIAGQNFNADNASATSTFKGGLTAGGGAFVVQQNGRLSNSILFSQNNSYDIGAAGAYPRSGYFNTDLVALNLKGSSLALQGSFLGTTYAIINTPGTDGIISLYNAATTGFTRLNFGGTAV